MTTRREQILELIKLHPEITAMRLGDLVDCDVETVHADIAELVKAGQITVDRVNGRNGVSTTGYRINPAFLGWKPPSNAGSTLQTASKDVAERENAAAAAADEENTTGAPTRASLALAYLEQHGTATNAKLRAAMGIPPKYAPSNFLGPALKKGLVARDGENWILARSTGTNAPATLKAPTAASRNVVPHGAKASVLTSQEAAPTDIDVPALASMSIGGFQVSHWQAGNLVVSANDHTVDLSPAQVHALRAFIGLMP
jgi:hypothetical protein